MTFKGTFPSYYKVYRNYEVKVYIQFAQTGGAFCVDIEGRSLDRENLDKDSFSMRLGGGTLTPANDCWFVFDDDNFYCVHLKENKYLHKEYLTETDKYTVILNYVFYNEVIPAKKYEAITNDLITLIRTEAEPL